MNILGIETSCDETACGIVTNGIDVRASVISAQLATHQQFGGVVPEVAAREHLKDLDRVVRQALSIAGMKIQDCDAIAVTRGPGLIGALLVGVSYAKALSVALKKPLIGVDHIYAHLHGALLGCDGAAVRYPALGFVVSGGHTNLYLMKSIREFDLIAQSQDDACGECFDKVAKILGLNYPGGPAIEKMAMGGDPSAFPMPQILEDRSQLSFSYSGLKTHMQNLVRRLNSPNINDLCASFQAEALGQLVRKLRIALSRNPETRSVLIAGGVSANQVFRQMVAQQIALPVFFPSLEFCGDNGAMIAASGYYFADQAKSFCPEWDAYSRHSEVGT